jgi:hypothetical protein
MARRARADRRPQGALRPPRPHGSPRPERRLPHTNCSAHTTRSGAYPLQDPLQALTRVSPDAAGFPATSAAGLDRPLRSIRRPGYLHEHMFPFRPSNVAAGLLEIADALLTPMAPSSCADGAGAGAAPSCRPPHPHRRPLARRTRRRPAPLAQPQPCLTPLGGPSRRAASRQAAPVAASS